MKHVPNTVFKLINGKPATAIFSTSEPEPLSMRLVAIMALGAEGSTGAEAAKTMNLTLKIMALPADVGELLLEDAEFEKIVRVCDNPRTPLFNNFIHGQIHILLNEAKAKKE